MSADLCWQIIRNNHAYLVKRRDIKKPFSTEANNLKNVNSARYNGFCRNRIIGIEPASDGKGIVLAFKTRKHKNKPAKNIVKTTIKSGPRRALNSIRRFIRFNHYRGDLKMAALRRASAILRSQRAQPFKKVRRVKRHIIKKTE
ncbi:60S ribosomal protein L28-like [Penaeus japonicus]|uniref:60S ribosomal protein L28-like n=1 Tax=Penaeus japonicus TaxID=27405 RepID=UPI001C711CB9|nr:60S ribosomal protein L28-like [Penaeus japonicus]